MMLSTRELSKLYSCGIYKTKVTRASQQNLVYKNQFIKIHIFWEATSKVKISNNFVAFSEYMNFNWSLLSLIMYRS